MELEHLYFEKVSGLKIHSDFHVLGSYFLKYGINQFALKEYQNEILPLANNIILTNRKAGSDAILQMVEDLCGGEFNNIEDVISLNQLSEHSKKYKKVAGFSIKELNSQESIIKL